MLLQRKHLANVEVRLWSRRSTLSLEMSHSILLPVLEEPKFIWISGYKFELTAWDNCLYVSENRAVDETCHFQKEIAWMKQQIQQTHEFTCQKYLHYWQQGCIVKYHLSLFT